METAPKSPAPAEAATASEQATITLPTAQPAAEQATLDPDATRQPSPSDTTPHCHEAPNGWPAIPGYDVLGVLGKGGMGVVYRARQHRLNRVVALKMILHAEHAGAEERRRFHAEAEAVARLHHPHIVQVYEVGERNGMPYFSLEYCPGGALSGKLDGTPLPPAEAARLLAHLALAMQAAHQAGVVHRDLKPANVLLADDGSPKITDFGLAKRMDGTRHTQSGAVMGTPSYMAPEQAGGRNDVGPAADVYALGAILYELLTGRPPFKGASALETILQVASLEPVSVRRLQPKVPGDLETICHKCLEKEPRKRYATAEALAADLRAFLDRRPIAARPVGPAERLAKAVRRRPAVSALAALVALAVLGGAAGVLYQYRETARALGVASQNADLYRAASVKAETALESESAARESEKIATLRQARNLYTAHMNLVQRAWEEADLQRARELLERHIPEDEKAPDFRGFEWYYYWRLTHAAAPRLTGLPGSVRALTASPDGRRLALACDNGSTFVCETTGGAKPAPFHVNGFVSCLAYSPDGKLLAAGTGRAREPGVVYLLDAQTLKVRHTLKGHSSRLFALAFTADGQTLISAATDIGDGNGTPWKRYYDIETARPCRGEVRFWNAANPGEGTAADFGTGGGLSLSVSPGGRWLAVGRADGRALLVDLPSRKVAETLGQHRYPVWAVAVADDGRVAAGGGQWDHPELTLWTRARAGTKYLGFGYTHLPGKGSQVTEVVPGSLAEACGLRPNDVIVEFHGTDVTQTAVNFRDRFNSLPPGRELALVVKRGAQRVVLKTTIPAPKAADSRLLPESLVGHTSGIQAAAYTRDGTRLLTVSLDRTLRVWEAHTGRRLAVYRGHTDGAWSLALLSDDQTAFTGGGDKTVFAWNLTEPQEYREVRMRSLGGQAILKASPADATFLLPVEGAEAQINAETGRVVRRLLNGRKWGYEPDGKLMLWYTAYKAKGNDLVVLLKVPLESLADPSSEEALSRQHPEFLRTPLARFSVPAGQANLLSLKAWSENSARCLLGVGFTLLEKTDDLQVWDIRKAARQPVALKPRPRRSEFSPTGKYLYAYYWDDASLHVWDLNAGHRVLLEKYGCTVSGATFSPGENYFAAATHDGIIRVWETDGMRLIHTFRTRADATWGLRFTRDERTLLASNWDGRIRLWDLQTGEERLTLNGPGGAAHDVAITPDGRTVIGAYDGMAVIWQAAKDGDAPKYRKK